MNKTNNKDKKTIDNENKNKQYEYDKNGNIIVNFSIRDDVEFLSPYSLNGLPTISQAIGDFIESSTKTFPPKQKLTLRFHGMNVNNKEKETYKKADTLFTNELFSFTNDVMQQVNKNLGGKLFEGNKVTKLGKYVLPLVNQDIAKFALVKAVSPKAETKVNDI